MILPLTKIFAKKLISYTLLFLVILVQACQPNKTKEVDKGLIKTVNYDSIRIALEDMFETDQGYRQQLNEKIQNGEPFDQELVNKMNRADSSNQQHVIRLLNTYGWIEKSKIGKKAADALFFIIQHADIKVMEQYFDQLKALANDNEADKVSAAMMEDRILMYNGKKQIYGTQAKSRMKTDGTPVYFVWPIKDATNVNKRRSDAGFSTTIEENAKRLNAVYDPNETIPDA